MRYTYDEDEEEASDGTSTRRSARQSGRNTPFESTGPTYTASGRQIRAPKTGEYGEGLLSREANGTDELAPEYASRAGTEDSSEQPVRGGGRATRNGGRHVVNGVNPRKRRRIDGYNDNDAMSEEDDASGGEWDSDRNEAEDEDRAMPDADDEDEAESGSSEDEESQSLVVKLKVPSKSPAPPGVKDEEAVVANGASTPMDVEDAKPGAVNVNGVPAADGLSAIQSGSSPAGPSSEYPTPSSSSLTAKTGVAAPVNHTVDRTAPDHAALPTTNGV